MSIARYTPGTNIAVKIPRADYDATVAFYRDTLGLDVATVAGSSSATVAESHTVRFGPVTLWLDRVDTATRSEVWFELGTDDLAAATDELAAIGVRTVDEVEPLEGDVADRSHWIRDPAGIVHLLLERDAT